MKTLGFKKITFSLITFASLISPTLLFSETSVVNDPSPIWSLFCSLIHATCKNTQSKSQHHNESNSPTLQILLNGNKSITLKSKANPNTTLIFNINDAGTNLKESAPKNINPPKNAVIDPSNSNESIQYHNDNYISKNSSGVIVGGPNIFSNYCFTFGYDCRATSPEGGTSLAAGIGAKAIGHDSIALGDSTVAKGVQSFASGYQSEANGGKSTALGLHSISGGYGSTASGGYVNAAGDFSSAFGFYTIAQGQAQFVIGQYNEARGSDPNHYQINNEYPTYEPPSAKDYLFIIGNGQPAYQDSHGTHHDQVNSNAFTVNWHGDVHASGDITAGGVIRTIAHGDLSMGTFTTGIAPH